MNGALIVALLRQRLASPMRVTVLSMMMLLPLLMAAAMRTMLPVHDSAYWFALVLAAGAIGQDVSSGVLHLTFARPVTRPSYVLNRWLAAAGGATALAVIQLLLATVISAARGAAPEAAEVAGLVLEGVLKAGTAAAILLLFSSLANGLGDLGIFVMTLVLLQVAGTVAAARGARVAVQVVEQLQHTLQPEASLLPWIVEHGPVPWLGIVSPLATITVALALAIVVVNRKELTYASG